MPDYNKLSEINSQGSSNNLSSLFSYLSSSKSKQGLKVLQAMLEYYFIKFQI
jgi:hypothetical protein